MVRSRFRPPAAGGIALVILGIVVVFFSIFNAVLVDDDIYTVQSLSAGSIPLILEKHGFWHMLHTLFFNVDLRSEYRLFGLSRIFHFLLVFPFGAIAWPYTAVIAVSQTATALGIYWLLRRLDVDRFQAGALAVVWLLSPFANTSAFFHYSSFIFPYQLTVACALVLQRLHDSEARGWLWCGTAIILCLAIVTTGEAHLAASVIILGSVVFATPSPRRVRQRVLDMVVVVLTMLLGIALHRWAWGVLSGGITEGGRFSFALPTFEEAALRTAVFMRSLLDGVETQVVPIVAFAKGWGLVTAFGAGLAMSLMWQYWWRDDAGNTTSLKRGWFDFRVGAALLVMFIASLGILWLLMMLSGYNSLIYRRYGYIPYTLGAMTLVALLTAPVLRRKVGTFPGLMGCGMIAWLWLTLNAACLPVIRAQDNAMWSAVAAVTTQKRDPAVLFVTGWGRPEMPGCELEPTSSPGLRGLSFPEIFESPLGAYWWEAEYPVAVLGAHLTGYCAIPEPDGRVRLFGNVALRKYPVSIPRESLVVVVNPSVTPPLWNSDLSQVRVFASWDAFEVASERELLGPWQTASGKVSLVVDGDSQFFLVDDQGNKIDVTIGPSRIYIPSQDNEGQVNPKRTWIDWLDGSVWTRTIPAFERNPKYQAAAGLLGPWFYGDKRCAIEFSGSEKRELILVSEGGARPLAALRGRSIYADVWKIQGEWLADGRTINWSNGTVWRRRSQRPAREKPAPR